MDGGFKTFSEVISFAVMREEESHEFYKYLAETTATPFLQTLFNDFAKEELQHKQALLDLDIGALEKALSKILDKQDDLGIASEKEHVVPDPAMDFEDGLVLAMQREDKAFELYSLLAELSLDDDISILFLGLAKEEKQHRVQIEKTYQSLYDK